MQIMENYTKSTESAHALTKTWNVRYVSIYQNIEIFIQYRDTILAFGCIDTLVWTV